MFLHAMRLLFGGAFLVLAIPCAIKIWFLIAVGDPAGRHGASLPFLATATALTGGAWLGFRALHRRADPAAKFRP